MTERIDECGTDLEASAQVVTYMTWACPDAKGHYQVLAVEKKMWEADMHAHQGDADHCLPIGAKLSDARGEMTVTGGAAHLLPNIFMTE